MFEWCKNRLEITGRSVFIDVMLQWVTGDEVPLYRYAVQQSIQLFLAGSAGVLKPVKSVEYPPYPGLVSHGTGPAIASNLAFQHWLELLQKDAVLNPDTVRQIDRIWTQSGLSAVRWETFPLAARQIMAQLMTRQYADWFGVAICADLSLNNVTDTEAFPGLIRQTHRKIRAACADGAYDTKRCHDELRRKKIKALIPPRTRAGYWPVEYVDRNQAVARQRLTESNAYWKLHTAYNRRAVAETAMYRVKQLFGGHLTLRDFDASVG